MLDVVAPSPCETSLSGTGLLSDRAVHANLHPAALTSLALQRGKSRLSANGTLAVETGVHTGRSVQDKIVADEPQITGDIWWGKINQKMLPADFVRLTGCVRAYLKGLVLFTRDLYAGADPAHRIRVWLVTTSAWARAVCPQHIHPPGERRTQQLRS